MSRLIARAAVVVSMIAAMLWAAPGAGAQPNSAEQIVFSGIGFGTFAGTPTPFGFWIWCEDEEANGAYAGACAGSMYFYELGLVRGVFGEVSESEEIHTMDVQSADGSVDCALTQGAETTTKGPTNTVNATCAAPSGGGTSTNAVVVVSGP